MQRREFLGATAAGAAALAAAGKAKPKRPRGPASRSASCPRIAWSRSVPVRYEADVAVIGGGIAGVSAAGIAAAMSVEAKCDPRALDAPDVRRTVERRGAELAV